MKITVAEHAIAHFWEEPPPDCREFWAFRWPVKAKVGDDIVFHYQGRPVAKAVIDEIQEPGHAKCDRTGKYENRWKVFWRPESFVDLR